MSTVADHDPATVLEQRTRAFAALYERQAYLVYNVALRVCGDPAAAARAAESAFLSGAGEDELAAAAVTAALAGLPARQRPNLPVAQLAELDEDWAWTPPPDELWQRVHAGLHRAAVTPPAGTRSARPVRRGAIVVCVLVAAAAGALYGTGTGLGGGGEAPRTSARAAAPPPAAPAPSAPAADAPADVPAEEVAPNPKVGDRAPAPKRKRLTPRELDKLRLRELAQLRRYQRRQADRELSPEARAEASREIAALQRVARDRLQAADRRERRLRRELARERELRARERRARERERAAREREDAARARREHERAPAPPAQTTPAAPAEEQDCLYNADDGSYICPEG